jgi:hypothetical protein
MGSMTEGTDGGPAFPAPSAASLIEILKAVAKRQDEKEWASRYDYLADETKLPLAIIKGGE